MAIEAEAGQITLSARQDSNLLEGWTIELNGPMVRLIVPTRREIWNRSANMVVAQWN